MMENILVLMTDWKDMEGEIETTRAMHKSIKSLKKKKN